MRQELQERMHGVWVLGHELSFLLQGLPVALLPILLVLLKLLGQKSLGLSSNQDKGLPCIVHNHTCHTHTHTHTFKERKDQA